MEEKFVKLTYGILQLDALTSTDKIVLARRLGWGNKPYYEKVTTVATVLNIGQKSVEKSIRKLKALGYWPAEGKPTRVEKEPTRVGSMSTGVGSRPTGVGENNSISPLKTCILLNNSLDNRLDQDKIAGLDGSPQTFFKKLEEENSVSSQTGEISAPTGSEAPIEDCDPSVAPTVPLGGDGRPLTKADMLGANCEAVFADKPEPYTEAQIKAAMNATPTPESIAAEFASIFDKK